MTKKRKAAEPEPEWCVQVSRYDRRAKRQGVWVVKLRHLTRDEAIAIAVNNNANRTTLTLYRAVVYDVAE
jgi:hypothetical protein